MDPGNSRIVNRLDAMAHHLGRHSGLLRNRHVGGSAGNNEDVAVVFRLGRRVERDRARELIVLCLGPFFGDGLIDVRRRPGCQHRPAAGAEVLEDADNLDHGLPLAKHYFGETTSQLAMAVDLCVAKILERQMLDPLHRISDGQLALADVFEYFLTVCSVHK